MRTTRRGLSGLMVGCAVALGMPYEAGAQETSAGRDPPGLAQRVAGGELPPLAERVGQQPEVLQALDGVGRYGGQLRYGLRGSSDYNNILRMVGPQGLVRWNLDYTDTIPNVAREVEVSEDGTTFTFHLRQGMKWSDGHPFTADDVMFNMEDIVLANTLAPLPPRYMSGGQPP